jgi:hypothetical protein
VKCSDRNLYVFVNRDPSILRLMVLLVSVEHNGEYAFLFFAMNHKLVWTKLPDSCVSLFVKSKEACFFSYLYVPDLREFSIELVVIQSDCIERPAHLRFRRMIYSGGPWINLRALWQYMAQGGFYKSASTHWWWDGDFNLAVCTDPRTDN